MRGTLESKDTPRKKQESVPPLPPAVPPPSIYILSKSTCALNIAVELQTTTYDLSPCLPFLTLAQLECSSTAPLSRSTSWKPSPYQTQSQSTMSMELQMR